MIRILHIMGCSDAGGISSVVLNYYRHMDRTEFRFDIALTIPTVGQNGRALQALGAEIHFLPLKSEGIAAFQTALADLLKQGRYDAVHVHESETCYVALRVAKQLGISCRIAHSHTSSPYEGLKGELRRLSGCLLNYHYASRVIGCGRLAGERVFGKWNMRRPRALVLPNAIDTQKFAFDEALRRQVRTELGLDGNYVLGMVGRLSPEKNPGYAVELLPRILETIPEAVLVMAGNGPEEDSIRQKIQTLGLEERVQLLGRRSDVHRLYQAFDVFLLPSYTEGYPVAAVEAMASGLPVLLSDAVTDELQFGTAVEYLPLKRPEQWTAALCRWKQDAGRQERQSEPARQGLDIHTAAKQLERIYREG